MYTHTQAFKRAPKPNNSSLRRLAVAITVVSASLAGAFHVSAADPGKGRGVDISTERAAADFEGRQIDLSKDWEEAQACWVDEVGAAKCFRSEAQMDRALVAAGKDLDSTNPPSAADKQEGFRAASCSSSLRLYRNNYYGGGVLYLTQRGYWTNLSWFGFDNVVSSYRVGGCTTAFKSGSGGSGYTYWGNTSAWAARSSMSGWNNVLSSIYIY